GTRSEFNGDFVWSDYVVQKGYAYVSQNKGTLNFTASNATDSTAEGTFVQAAMPNLLSTLPPAILNYPDYVASGFNPNSIAAKNILAAGYPPDLTTIQAGITISLWGLHYLQFWEVTMCQWQKRLDSAYDTYGTGLGIYVYVNRLSLSNVAENL